LTKARAFSMKISPVRSPRQVRVERKVVPGTDFTMIFLREFRGRQS